MFFSTSNRILRSTEAKKAMGCLENESIIRSARAMRLYLLRSLINQGKTKLLSIGRQKADISFSKTSTDND